jgi:hypothetical protein
MSERFYLYNPPIPRELKKMHEEALNNELRWQGGFLFSDREESDLNHIESMFDMHDEVSHKYPALFSEVDNDQTSHMIYIHDTGEILAHDLAHSVPNYDILRPKVKHRERAAFRFLTGQYVDDIELRAYIREIYARYERKSPTDKIAQYVQLLDKAQATKFGAEFVFPARKLTKKHERIQQANHIFGLYVEPAAKLFPLISSEAQDELGEFMDNQMLILRRNGYRADEVDPYRKKLQDIFTTLGR